MHSRPIDSQAPGSTKYELDSRHAEAEVAEEPEDVELGEDQDAKVSHDVMMSCCVIQANK